jgi:DNA-binding SARP family transcriptional activator
MLSSRLTTLGGFAFKVNETSTRGPATRKARALMAFLVMNQEADVGRESLLELFWPDADPERSRACLKTALWSIRRCLATLGADPDDFFLATKSIVRWTGGTNCDALEFAKLAAHDEAKSSREALQLYHGDFLEGDYDNWTVSERERLAALYERVLARVATMSKDTEAAQRFIARNPYDEDVYATLIEAELTAGRRSSAVAWVERCRNALLEVGEKPSPAFETRFGAIARIDVTPPNELTLPFAGREVELALLTGRFSDVATGRGNITLVHGDAGIGKSTLLGRAAQLATENNLRLLVVHCGDQVPSTFGSWRTIFNAVTREDFDTFVATHAGDPTAAIVQAIAAQLSEPTALVVDDAHELTAGSFEILVALAKAAASRHAVVVGLRPEGLSNLRSQLADVPFEELPIRPLARGDLRWALAHALGDEQPDLLDVLYNRTLGHPLFFAGLLNSLVTAGVLARDRNGWRLAKPLDADFELPDSIKRFIETRLSSRGETPRRVACALALEPVASADDLMAVLGMEEPSVLDALDDLLALGLIVQPDSGPQFAFSHDLIREVAAVGLNAGRRAVLHRAFARRIEASDETESSLRLARHANAAGEFLLAAQSYLKSAERALQDHAVQDAVDRCCAGVRSAERLEPSVAREILLALHATAAHAAIAGGDATDAIAEARVAVSLARASGNFRECVQAILALAVVEGVAFHIQEQRSDAVEAAENARLCLDDELEAQALVQCASAAREFGLRDEALRAGDSARAVALKSGRSDIALAALMELLRTQITWWLFTNALPSARIGLEEARRTEPLTEAAFLQARSTLWYLLERFDEAEADLQAALRITSENPLPLLRFACHYMTAKVAVAQQKWDQAIGAADEAAALTNIAKLPRRSEALALMRIDIFLQRNRVADTDAAHELALSLDESASPQGAIAWSDCVDLAQARVAARMRRSDAATLLRRTLNTLEENAHRAPLDADRAFARLAEAASDVEDAVVANRARARAQHYRSLRRAAADTEWGGRVFDQMTVIT